MTWKLNNEGAYESGEYIIEHLPKRNAEKPYFLYVKNGKQGWYNFITNCATLDIAKRKAAGF